VFIDDESAGSAGADVNPEELDTPSHPRSSVSCRGAAHRACGDGASPVSTPCC
jgi:hypothetical protein